MPVATHRLPHECARTHAGQYGHTDHSSEIEAMRNLREQGKLAPSVADKILGDNAAILYRL